MIDSYYDSLASAAPVKFWALSILKTSNLLTTVFEAIGLEISQDGQKAGGTHSLSLLRIAAD